MQAITEVLQMTQTHLTKLSTAQTSERWQKIEPLIREDLIRDGIDLVPPNLAEIFGKVHTGESMSGKGVCFCGTTGTGKTLRMRWISNAFDIPMVGAVELCDCLMRAETLVEKNDLLRCSAPRWSVYPRHWNDLIIDDLGTEPDEQKTYGTKRYLMVDALERRYEVFPRWKTHITTNLRLPDLKDRYGDRVFSRLNEMCCFITLAGKDRRMN